MRITRPFPAIPSAWAGNPASGAARPRPGATHCAALSVAAILMTSGSAHAAGPVLKEGYPFAPGDSFTYSYHDTQTAQSGCTGKPASTSTSYTEVTTIQPEIDYSYPPGNVAKVYPFRTTATATTSKGTLTVTNTEYRNFVTSGKTTELVDYGLDYISDDQTASNVTKHTQTTRKYLTPLMRDQFPRKAGAMLALPVTFNEIIDNYYDTTTKENILQSNATRKADGSYTLSGETYDVPFSVDQKSNGTGVGIEGPSSAPEQWSFALPEAAASGNVIPATVSYAGKTGTNLVPDWFPGSAAAPSPLASSAYIDKGTTKVPAGCGTYAGKKATLLEITYTNLAPVQGYLYTEIDTSYVINNVGRVCIEVTRDEKIYDQEVTGKCTTATTFHSTEGLVSESIH